MEALTDYHFVVAEVSLALAGFSGVIVAIRKGKDRPVTDTDRLGLTHILLASGFAMAFALAPHALVSAGLSGTLAYQFCSLLLGLSLIVANVLAAMATRTKTPRNRATFWTLVPLGLLLGVAMALTVMGVLTDVDFYPLALLWLLLVAFTQFFLFLLSEWDNP